MRGQVVFFLLMLGLLVALVPGQAQTVTATLEGRVSDSSGAVVPGAKVAAVNASTGFSRSDVTNDAGEYRLLSMPVGDYAVTVEKAGFKRETKKVTLLVGGVGTVDFTLAVGELTQEVEVQASAEAPEPTRTAVSSVINQRQIESLPVNGRQFIDFALLAPGVAIGDTTSGSTDVIIEPVTKLSFAGQNIHYNFIAIDGADNMSTASGIQKTTPSQEAVQEFRVVNSIYSAEFGRAVGGIVNIITRSGTNELHGSAYDFFRNDAMDARSILASPGLNKLRQNQFGFVLGGPVKKDKTFVFDNYEGQRRSEAPFYNSAVLSNIQAINTVKVTRYGLPPENLNVTRNSDYDNFLVKLDHNVSQRHYLSGRYFFNDARFRNLSPLNDGFDLPSAFKDNFFRDQSMATNLTSSFSADVVNELHAQYARRHFDFPVTHSQPALEVTNLFKAGVNRGNPDFYTESRFELVDNFTRHHGNHTLMLGGNFNYVTTVESFPLFFPFEAHFGSVDDLLSGTPSVIFFEKFDPNATGVDKSVFLGTRFADAIRNQAKGELARTYDGLYLQDKWRATPNLTLNLGLRYEFETWPKKAIDNDWNNFDPRFGFAYSLGTKRNVVLRGGFGLFHGTIPSPLFMCQEAVCGGSGPYPGREKKEDDVNGRTTTFAFASIPPVMQQALTGLFSTGRFPVVSTPFDFLAEAVIVRFARDHQAPYGLQMSMSVEFEPLPQTTVNASYLRVKGVHLGSFFNVNQPNPSGLLESGKTDFALFRPVPAPPFLHRLISVPGVRNPKFAVYLEADSRWNSVFDGLLLDVKKRMGHHFAFGASYTFSKAIDDGPNPSFVLIPENSSRFDLERALSSDDVRHRFVLNSTIDGPTQVNYLLRDFHFGLIVTLESPHHFTKFAGFDANGDVFDVNDRVGLDARNTFEGDSLQSVDLRLSRTFPIGEKARAEFIAESFNTFNTLNVRFFNTVYGDSIFNPPGTPGTFREGARNPFYGTPRAIFNPRQIQFALRFSF